MDNGVIILLAGEIVSAHVANNNVAVGDLPALIRSVHQALIDTGAPAAALEREPAVSVRASVKPTAVTCLECGATGKVLKRHLLISHGLTAQEYRQRWNLSPDHPLVAPEYAARRSQLAKHNGLGQKPIQTADD